MNSRSILINALKRSGKQRGLRIVKQNNNLCDGHIKKADHNLIVMTDLSRLGHDDWVVVTAYYAMYQSALSLLAKIGMDTKDHVSTVAILDYFFGEHISNEYIEKFNQIKEKKDRVEAITIQEKYIDYMWRAKRARETIQYGVSISYEETDEIMQHTRDFVSKIKIVVNELDDKLIEVINGQKDELRKIAAGGQL